MGQGIAGEDPFYPIVGFYFTVSFEGLGAKMDSKFKKVSGITMEMADMLTIKEGGENSAVHELPGKVSYSDLVLERGMLSPDSALTKWCLGFFNNDYNKSLEAKNIEVSLLNQDGDKLFTWQFVKAYPKKIEIGGFDALANGDAAIVVETMTFKFQTLNII